MLRLASMLRAALTEFTVRHAHATELRPAPVHSPDSCTVHNYTWTLVAGLALILVAQLPSMSRAEWVTLGTTLFLIAYSTCAVVLAGIQGALGWRSVGHACMHVGSGARVPAPCPPVSPPPALTRTACRCRLLRRRRQGCQLLHSWQHNCERDGLRVLGGGYSGGCLQPCGHCLDLPSPPPPPHPSIPTYAEPCDERLQCPGRRGLRFCKQHYPGSAGHDPA